MRKLNLMPARCPKGAKGFLFALSIFLITSICYCPSSSAGEFDFYTADLISKESYRLISMDFQNASLKTVLKIFSEQAGLNFIAAQGVQDRMITLYLDKVPLQEALNKIMAANNLIYELEPGGNIFIVKEWGRPDIDTVTKVYRLKYTRLSGSKLQEAIDGAGDSDEEGGEESEEEGGEGEGEDEEGGIGGGIEDAVKGVMSSHGKLIVDFRTNSLIITDIASQFELIERIIALLDVPTPQIMIEVEMLDVSKRTIDELGVDTTAPLTSFTGASRETKWPFWNMGSATADAPEFTYGTLSSAVFTAVLELLTTDTKTRFLARPRILTLNNETAEIKIITQEAIGQNTVTSSSEGTAVTEIEAERYETGVSLKVTPQADTESGYVTMFIEPVVTEAKTGSTFSGTTYKDPEVRSSATTLMVKDSETIVVGGLIKTDTETTVKKIPFLGDIPLLGALFRHKDEDDLERELIVFITPHILNHQGALALARVDSAPPVNMPLREQDASQLKKEQIDNMLERWEN